MRRFVYEKSDGVVAGAGGHSLISFLIDQHRRKLIKITKMHTDSKARPHFAGVRFSNRRKIRDT